MRQHSTDSTGGCTADDSSEDPSLSFIESSEESIDKDDRPDAIVDGLEADELVSEGLTDKLHPALEFHFTTGSYAADLEVTGVIRVEQSVGESARRRGPQLARSAHANPLMGPNLVIRPDKVIKQDLLFAEVESGRTCCFRLHLAVHSLVGTVLVRRGLVSAFVCDAEPHPPNIEPCQARDAERSKGLTIVGANAFWKTDISEEDFHRAAHVIQSRGRQGFAGQDVPRETVLDGEGVTHGSVAKPKLTFEIDSHELVWPISLELRLSRMPPSTTRPAFPDDEEVILVAEDCGKLPKGIVVQVIEVLA